MLAYERTNLCGNVALAIGVELKKGPIQFQLVQFFKKLFLLQKTYFEAKVLKMLKKCSDYNTCNIRDLFNGDCFKTF